MANMILVGSLLVLALLGRVEPFKMLSKPAQPPGGQEQPESFYQAPLFMPTARLQPSQAYYSQAPVRQAEGTKGASLIRQTLPAAQPLPVQAGPRPLAYVIVRAIQAPQYQYQYQYLQPVRYQPAYYPAAPEQPIYRAPVLRQSTKGGETLRQEEQQQQQQEEVGEEQQQPQQQQQQQQPQQQQQQQQESAAPPAGKGKFAKLKTHFEQFAASAKAKLSLGSSYQVISEELVPVQQPQQPQQQQQQQQESQQPQPQQPQQQQKIQVDQEKIAEIHQEQQETLKQEQDSQYPEQPPATKEAPRLEASKLPEASRVQPVKEAPRLETIETKSKREQTRIQQHLAGF